MESKKAINRIKVMLVEKNRTSKWLAKEMGRDPATISKWCTNIQLMPLFQPDFGKDNEVHDT